MNKLSFSIDELNMITEISDSQLAVLEIFVCHDGMNLHEKPISTETLKLASETLHNKFLVAGFNGVDFKGHERDQRIVGFFPKENNMRYVEKNGKTYLVAEAIMSKIYAQWAYDVFTDENIKRGVSMEITVLETEMKDGYEWIKTFLFNGVTILGEGVQPACPDSDAKVFKFSESEMVECEELYTKCKFTPEKYDGIDFKIPQNIKDKVQFGLNLRKRHKRGGTSVGFATARYLTNNNEISPEKARHIASYFSTHINDNLEDINRNTNEPSNEYITWCLSGDDEGWRWSKKIVEQMNRRDEEFMKNEDFRMPVKEGDYTIEVDKSKESLSEKSWGEVDKEYLMRRVVNARNAETVVDDIYMVVEEGWQDAPSQKLKYPVMQLIGEKLVYNKGGLLAAQIRAEGQDLSVVVDKIKKIRERLGVLPEQKEEEMGAKLMDKVEMMKQVSEMEEMKDYKILEMEDGNMYFINKETREMYGIKYEMEDDTIKIDIEQMKPAKMACKYEMMEEEEREDKDVYMNMFSVLQLKTNQIDFSYENKRKILHDKAKEVMADRWLYIEDFDEEYVYIMCCDELKQYAYDAETYELDLNSMKKVCPQTHYLEFNADANIENVAQEVQQELEDENMKEQMEDADKLEVVEVPEVPEVEEDLDEEKEKMANVGETLRDMGYCIDDVKALAKFKEDVLTEQLKQNIEFACGKVADDIPADKLSEWKNKVSEFENFSAWENALKSEAYEFSKTKEPEAEKETIVRYAHSVDGDKKDKKNFWEC